MKSVVLGVGRMNPPTKGHIKLLETMKQVAKDNGNIRALFLLTKKVSESDPLSYEEKVNLLSHVGVEFGDKDNNPHIFALVKRLIEEEGYEEIYFVFGSDRLNMDAMAGEYALRWGAKKVHYVSLPRNSKVLKGSSLPIEDMSATLVRKAVRENDYETYEKMIGVQEKDVKPLWNLLRERLTN